MTKRLRFYAYLFTFLYIHQSLSAQDFALAQLEKSPRHHEWVNVEYEGRKVNCFVAYPEKNKKTTSVIVIHENRGLNDWARSFADQIAAEGYLAIAPDLLSDFSTEYKKTGDFPNTDEARKALYQLKPEQITKDLAAVQQYIAKVPASNGKVVVIGFCWGGGQCFRYATNNISIQASIVFYGGSPADSTTLKNVQAPVYAFYAENDERINARIADTEKMMKAENKKYDYKIYAGGGHGFMRSGEDPQGSAENKKAREEAWFRLREILKKI